MSFTLYILHNIFIYLFKSKEKPEQRYKVL